MATATCQFTQGIVIGGSGESVFGFSTGAVVTMTDDAGAGAISYLWEIVSWPGPLASPPAISNSTTQVATVTPTQDGVYIVRLTRTDGTGTTVDLKFFGVQDEDNLTLPSAGQTGNMTNQSVAAQAAGWAGRANASTNFQVDAYLRHLKSRLGTYVGKVATVTHSSASPVTSPVTLGTDRSFRYLTVTGTGAYTEELVNSPVPYQGGSFHYRATLQVGAGSFTVKNGVGGTTLITLSAPPTGVASTTYDLEFFSDGSNWVLHHVSIVDAKALRIEESVTFVSGDQSNKETTFKRIGANRFNVAKFPSTATFTFEVLAQVTTGSLTAHIQLYNVTEGLYVGTPLSTSSLTAAFLSQTVSLTGEKDYEVHLKLTTPGAESDLSICSNAKIVARWA